MRVYIILETYNEYPESGGGLQGVAGVFASLENAEEYSDKMAKKYGKDGYYYEIQDWEVE